MPGVTPVDDTTTHTVFTKRSAPVGGAVAGWALMVAGVTTTATARRPASIETTTHVRWSHASVFDAPWSRRHWIPCCRRSPAAQPPDLPGSPGNGGLALPDGFEAVVLHDGVGRARHLAVTDDGIVYVKLRTPQAEGAGRAARHLG